MAEGPSMVELLVRMVFSLGLVLGLLVLCAKVARNKGHSLRLPGFGSLGGGRKEPAIQVIERQSLTKNASMAVVQVGDKTMVVGITQHGVSLLAEHADGLGAGPSAEDDLNPSAFDADDDEDDRELVGATVGTLSIREAKGNLPSVPGHAADAANRPDRPPRMSFVDALRELTVRKV
jgi:flagellar biogenesis protein FliO